MFTLKKGAVHVLPILHHRLEMAAEARRAYLELKPDCVAVELPEAMQEQLLQAASRLPDLSVVVADDRTYYLAEPCDPAFEGLRSALEEGKPAFCIDLDLLDYPDLPQNFPDSYSITKIGLENYYRAYQKILASKELLQLQADRSRELQMAKRLKELSLSYDRILFICGMDHAEPILSYLDRGTYPEAPLAERSKIELCTLSDISCREVMAECAWFTLGYEKARSLPEGMPPDRQKMLIDLYKEAITPYEENSGSRFASYNLRNLMKYVRNYSLINERLMPSLFQLLTAAKGCVDHNYAYEVWELATDYPPLKNLDNLPELNLSVEEVWGHGKYIQFHLREKQKEKALFKRKRKDLSQAQFRPLSPFSLCSYQPEDLSIEKFGSFLKKKSLQLTLEEKARTVPFSTSLEDGIDTKETIRHWPEKKLYVKVSGKPEGGVGSLVVIFDEDFSESEEGGEEKFPWKMTWLGEHDQESDMAFYASPLGEQLVGPGICRCTYGGMMLSYPPRRLFDVWTDPDYGELDKKSEVLLAAAIDYSMQPLISYVSAKPPGSKLKSYAGRFGKKVVYIPIGQLSPVTLNKIRRFHVLDGHDKRKIADEYITPP